MPEPGDKPGRSQWIYFKPGINGKLVHKTMKGYVDLQLPARADDLDELRSYETPETSHWVKAGLSAALRITVEPMDLEAFNAQQAREALQAAGKLLTYARRQDL
jgi:hypothetical protein